MPAPLTPEERDCIIALLQQNKPLPAAFQERLFPSLSTGTYYWPGKAHSERGALPAESALPFSVMATWGKLSHGKRNQLFHGDNLAVVEWLLRTQGHADAPDRPKFIYLDPPFSVGNDFHARLNNEEVREFEAARAVAHSREPGDAGPAGNSASQAGERGRPDMTNGSMPSTDTAGAVPDPAEAPGEVRSDLRDTHHVFAYSDIWEGGMAGYLSMLWPRLIAMRELLADDGCLCVHCDWRAAHRIRLLLDECFGPERFVNEIIWHYTGGGRSRRYFSRKHDTLLVYAKGSRWTFNVDSVRQPYKKSSGYARSGIVSAAGKRYMPHPQGTPADDVWEIPIINPLSHERLGYATQKPLQLASRLIAAFTDPGDTVADFFCGSGTTLVAAQELGRHWTGCDTGELAIHLVCKRLLALTHTPGTVPGPGFALLSQH